MAQKYKYILISFVLVLFTSLLMRYQVSAAEMAEGVAIDVEIIGKSVSEGTIISLNDGKYMPSTIPYDNSVFGVVTDHPAVLFKDLATKNKRSVITMGKALVRISTINGPIKAGDLITTSSIPGVAQKATENGYVIGISYDDYTAKDPNKIGTIYATLHLNFGMISMSLRENLLASFKRGSSAPFASPLNALRYLIAGTVALLSFATGFWFFGKISSRGVEAVGRNPLARRFILLSVIYNVFITIVVMVSGVALAYMILVI
jgi:hypothetical protein